VFKLPSLLDRIVMIYGRIKGNARVLLLTEPLWSIPMPWLFYYLPLFLAHIGLSEVEIGYVIAFSSVLHVICPPLSSFFAKRWGFKKAFILLDAIGWIPWLVIWVLARSSIHAFIATSFMAFVAMAATLWECLLMEGTDPDVRPTIYGSIQMIYLIGNLLTPTAGYVIHVKGLGYGYKLLCLLAISSLSIMYLVRALYLKEPASVKEEPYFSYDMVLELLIKKKGLLVILSINALWSFQLTIMSTFLVLLLVDPRAFMLTESEVAMVPFVSSLVQLLVVLLMVPRVTSHIQTAVLSLSYMVSTATLALIFFIPPRSLSLVLVFAFLDAIPSSLMWPLNRAILFAFMGSLGPGSKTKIIALANMLGSLASAIAGPIGGILFSMDPLLPFILIIGTRMTSGFMLMLSSRLLK